MREPLFDVIDELDAGMATIKNIKTHSRINIPIVLKNESIVFVR